MLYRMISMILIFGMLLCYAPQVTDSMEMDMQETVDGGTVITNLNSGRRIVGLDDVSLDFGVQRFIQNLCYDADLDYKFVYAMIWSESNFRWQIGDGNLEHNAIGYFQISTVNEERMMKEYGLDIYDPYDNLEAGVRIIQELYEMFPDGYRGYDQKTCVIMAYKCGLSRGIELMDQGVILGVVQTILDKEQDFEL